MAFTTGNDVNILQASDATTVTAREGDDRYIISGDLIADNQTISITDTLGANTIQLVGGLSITSSSVTADAAQLTLSNGAVITLLGASTFTYQIGGDSLTGTGGASQDYSTFVTTSLGLDSVPAEGEAPVSGEAVSVNEDGTTTGGSTGGETLTLTSDASSVNEGGTVTYSIANGEADTEYTYTISGVDTADIDGGSLTGTVTTNASGAVSFDVTLLEDSATEGAETMVVTVGSVTSSVTVNDTSAAPDFELTTAGDRLEDEMTSGNDVIVGPQGTLGSTDVILDESTSDSDSLTAYLSAEVAPTIQKIEDVNLIWTNNTDLSFDAANSSDNTFNLSSNSGVFSGSATVKNVGSNEVVADSATITDTLTVQGSIDTTIDAGSAVNVTLGTAGTVTTVGVKTAADVTVNNSITLDNSAATSVEEVTISSTVADVVVTEAAFSADKLTFAGENSIIYNGVLTTEEVVNELTGDATLTVQSNADTTLDTTKIGADLIELDGGNNTAITVAANQNFNLKADTTSVASFTDGSGVTDAVVNLDLQASINTVAGLDVSGIKTLNLDVDTSDETIGLLIVDGNNKVNVTGSKALIISDMTGSAGAIEVDASAMTGKFTITDTGQDLITSIIGSDTAENNITVASTSNKTVIETGSANDTIETDTVTTGALTIDAGDGNNTVNADALTLATSAASITAGSGDDTIALNAGGNLTLAKELVIDAGDGNNTIDLSSQTTAFLDITTGDGDDTLDLAEFTTAGTASSSNATTIATGAGTDTIDLSAYEAGKLTVTSGAGKTTVTLKADSTATQEFTFNAGSTSDVLVLGNEGTAAIDTSLAKAFDITSVSNLEVVEGSTLAGWQLSGEDFNMKGLNPDGTPIASDATMIVSVKDVSSDLAETTDLSNLNFSQTTTEYIATVTVNGLDDVADNIVASTQDDVIDTGNGSVKDIIDISQGGNDSIVINATAGTDDSTYTSDNDYMTSVTGFTASTKANGADLIDLTSGGTVAVASDDSSVDVAAAVADAGTHTVTASITDGILTVGGTDLTKVNTLAEWQDVAELAVAENGAIGDTVAFEFSGNTYVYTATNVSGGTEAGNLVELVGLQSVTSVVGTSGTVDFTNAAANAIIIG